MRQYRIIHQRLGAKASVLEPHVHSNLYDRPEINAAIEHLRTNPHIDGIAMLLDGNDRFNIMCFTQEAEAPNSFKFAAPDIKGVLREQLVKLHELTEERLAACESDDDLESACTELSALLVATSGTVEALVAAEGGE